MKTLDSYIYRLTAKIIFSPFFLPKSVQGVYLRRSTAAGEAVLGKSDIDIAIIIDDFKSATEELTSLERFIKRYRLLKSLCPVLGELFIFNHEDLTYWRMNKPFRGILANNWIRLYGKSIPVVNLTIPKEDIIAEFCFWLFDILAGVYKRRDIFGINSRHCAVALLEIYNAYFTLEGVFPLPKAAKREILDFLIKKNKDYRKFKKLLYGLNFYDCQRLKDWIYKEALALAERISPYNREFQGGDITPLTLALSHLGRGSGESGQNSGIRTVPTTANALKLYLGYWNPWEYYSIKKLNPSLKLPCPSKEAMNRYFAKHINRHLVRYPLIMGKDYSKYRNIILQARLFNDYNIICQNEEELISKYKTYYSDLPSGAGTKEYQLLWDIVGRLYHEFKGFCNNSR